MHSILNAQYTQCTVYSMHSILNAQYTQWTVYSMQRVKNTTCQVLSGLPEECSTTDHEKTIVSRKGYFT